MRESVSRRARASKGLKEHLFLKSKLSPFGRACIGIWPDNAPKMLSQKAKISIRNANQILRGQRRASARAIHALNSEFV